MAHVWQCGRCKKTEDSSPKDWEHRGLPVRGSEGARSNLDYLLCAECDDSLYRWLHRRDGNLATVVKQEPEWSTRVPLAEFVKIMGSWPPPEIVGRGFVQPDDNTPYTPKADDGV